MKLLFLSPVDRLPDGSVVTCIVVGPGAAGTICVGTVVVVVIVGAVIGTVAAGTIFGTVVSVVLVSTAIGTVAAGTICVGTVVSVIIVDTAIGTVAAGTICVGTVVSVLSPAPSVSAALQSASSPSACHHGVHAVTSSAQCHPDQQKNPNN
jgi:hypothetical protein